MRTRFWWVLILAAAGCPCFAGGLGVTFTTNTFLPLDGLSEYPVPPGLYGRVGLCWLPGSHLEIEAVHVPQITPGFYSQAFTGVSVGWWLLERKRSLYFNLSAEAGFLYGLDATRLITVKLTPIILGGPHFRYGDRLLSTGLVWDPDLRRVFLQLQLVGISLFF